MGRGAAVWGELPNRAPTRTTRLVWRVVQENECLPLDELICSLYFLAITGHIFMLGQQNARGLAEILMGTSWVLISYSWP